MLTANEQKRIKQIRQSLKKWKRKKVDMTTWESPFFLRIIDRLTRKKK